MRNLTPITGAKFLAIDWDRKHVRVGKQMDAWSMPFKYYSTVFPNFSHFVLILRSRLNSYSKDTIIFKLAFSAWIISMCGLNRLKPLTVPWALKFAYYSNSNSQDSQCPGKENGWWKYVLPHKFVYFSKTWPSMRGYSLKGTWRAPVVALFIARVW